jgi:RNA polymerase sigma-70 factor (ECF subfamily)
MTKDITQSLNDLQLIKEAQQGSQKAFTKLFNNYRHYILSFIILLIRNATDAEDILIDVFAKAFDKINTFNPTYNFGTWLYRIALNKSIDYMRTKKRGPIFTDSIIHDVEQHIINRVPSLGFSPEDILIGDEQKAKLKVLVANMNPTSKRIVELRFEQGRTYADIADELGAQISTVGAQVHRARKILYKLLKESE